MLSAKALVRNDDVRGRLWTSVFYVLALALWAYWHSMPGEGRWPGL